MENKETFLQRDKKLNHDDQFFIPTLIGQFYGHEEEKRGITSLATD